MHGMLDQLSWRCIYR